MDAAAACWESGCAKGAPLDMRDRKNAEVELRSNADGKGKLTGCCEEGPGDLYVPGDRASRLLERERTACKWPERMQETWNGSHFVGRPGLGAVVKNLIPIGRNTT